MFFSLKRPFSSSSFKTCFLLNLFCKDCFKFLASNAVTLLPILSVSGADNPLFPKGSLLKLPLSEP